MDLPDLTPMVKIEVVVDAQDGPFVQELMRAEGATGLTSLTGLAGFGHHGRHGSRLLFNEDGGQSMVITVMPEAGAGGVLAGLRAFLADRAGVVWVTRTHVLRGDYYSRDA